MELIENLNWRYAVKRMTGAKVPQQKVAAILEAARLSASSAGLQPYKIIVVKDEATKKLLQPAAYNQPQITEASHLLIFAAYENITAQHIDDYMNLQAAVKKVTAESLAPFKERLVTSILPRTKEENFNWAARQAYIALGTALIAAANEAVDATPMEGFDPVQHNQILGLTAKGYSAVVMATVGYRAEADKYSTAPKVRFKAEEVIEHV